MTTKVPATVVTGLSTIATSGLLSDGTGVLNASHGANIASAYSNYLVE
jgi:hypothetical protein